MRIAIANWTDRRAGGAESYLDVLIPGLIRAGHEVFFLCEMGEPADRDRISQSAAMAVWRASEIGLEAALARVREWRPEVSYAHGLHSLALEREFAKSAPAVIFAHDYRGTCISGEKMFKLPHHQPCARVFGWRCLLKYYPRRCGGRSPISMMRMFRIQAGRLAALNAYDRIVTASEHMRGEYLRHGFAPETVRTVIPPVRADGPDWIGDCGFSFHPTAGWRLVFVGRMTHPKGGALLLDALPRVSEALDAPISLTFVGDGDARREWESRARALMARNRDLYVEFTGWLSGAELHAVVKHAHLHVMPSVWPEPFGLSGPELAARGLPAAAFAVGGIPEWLRDGANGFLAPGDPPTSAGLAEAIIRCLSKEATYARLRAGAIESATRFSVDAHIADLEPVFAEAVANRAAGGGKTA